VPDEIINRASRTKGVQFATFGCSMRLLRVCLTVALAVARPE
jgi:hypothetical protein